MSAELTRRRFRFWTRDELVAAVKELESAMVSGARFVNYTGGGSVTYVGEGEFKTAIRDLYEAIDLIDGVSPKPRVRHVLTYTKSKGL
jgi:hypothetical protein